MKYYLPFQMQKTLYFLLIKRNGNENGIGTFEHGRLHGMHCVYSQSSFRDIAHREIAVLSR